MAKTYNRTVKVFIDGKEVENTIPGIQKRIRELTREIKQMTIGTEEYNKKVKEIAQLNSILAEHKRAVRGVVEESRSLVSKLGSMADFFNKWYYSLQTGLDALGGVTTTIRQCVNDYADMEESMADVRKYTGQTKAEVHDMNEDFKRMDTRTSREQLNALAGAAGRLGITSKEMIEEFVDGADKINVALGDDLGEGAVDKIGKLAHMFGEDEKKGLRGAMLATGSAVNDLAQSSSANAGYIVNFTADLSGVAIQAGMTQTQLMGLASALDQNMQEEATASTVFSQLITKMYQEPARFAALAGEDVKEFTNLLKTNANEALLKFLSAMQASGGFDKMAPLFSEMKLEGTRAVGVLTSVASHIDQVREAQAIAFNAYERGNSVLQEFNTQNSTVQADIDKAKKQFLDLSVELGEKLLPIVKHGINAGSMLVKTMKIVYQVGEFLAQHIVAVTALTASMVFYTGVLTMAIIKEKALLAVQKTAVFLNEAYAASVTLMRSALVALHATWTLLTKGVQGYIVVMRAAKIASLTNPWMALATVLSIVGVAVYSAVKAWRAHKKAVHDNLQSVKEANAIRKQQEEISKKVADSHVEEKTRLEQLNKIIHSNAFSVNERRAAIAAMQEIVPSYHASISNEGKLYNDNINTVKEYIKQLDNLAMAQAIIEQKTDIARQRLELKLKERRIRYSIKSVDAEIEAHPETYRHSEGYSGGRKTRVSSYEYNKKMQERGVHEARLKENLSQQSVLDARERSLENLINKDKGLRQAVTSQIVKGNSTGSPAVTHNKPGHYVSPEDAAKAARKEEDARRKAEVEARKKTQQELDGITAEYENRRSEAMQDYLEGRIATQEDYDRRIEDLQLEELQRKLEVAGLEPKKRAEIQKQIFEYKVKLYDQLRQLEDTFGDTEAERLAVELDAIKRKYDEDLALLESLHDKKLISEEQYQTDLARLKERYAKDEEKAKKESASRVISDARSTFDDLMEAQRKHNVREGRIDELSQAERLEAWKKHLGKLLDDTTISNEQREAIQQQIDDAELEQTENTLKKKQELTQKYNDIICEVIVQAGQQLGEQLGKVLQGEKADFKEFLKGMLVLMIDALEKTVLAARAASLAKNVGTLGLAGLAKTAVETALITAAFEMAKAAVNSFDSGGFTPSGAWNKPQGIVHSNEFVANRFATANPNVLPVLNLIDEAQRAGSVSRLSAEAVAAVVPTGSSPVRVSRPSRDTGYAASPDNAALLAVLSRMVRSLNTIDDRFSTPIIAETYATGRHGTMEAERLVNKMKSNVSRKRK